VAEKKDKVKERWTETVRERKFKIETIARVGCMNIEGWL
jgi:hypothetical protein